MSARPRLVEEGTPIPKASASAAAEAAGVRNANQPPTRQHHGTDNQNHYQGRQMHGSRHYEGHGHGAVATHITIGGGGAGGGGSSTAYSSSQLKQPQQPNHYYHGSTDSNMDHLISATCMPLDGGQQNHTRTTSVSTAHRTSSLSAAAGPVANAGARTSSKHNRNGPTTQLHTHLVIGGGSRSGGGERHDRQRNSNPHAGTHDMQQQRQYHAAATGTTHSSGPGSHPHRLVIGGYTGHVSAGMPLPRAMNAERNVGVGRQDFLTQHASNAGAAVPAPPASGQSELTPDEYDYDLLGGGVPDHRFAQYADSNAPGDAGPSHADTSINVADVAERMEVEDIIPLPPLIVIDGANVAYAYGKAKSAGNNAIVSFHSAHSSDHSSGNASKYSRQGSSFGRSFQADAKGILIACNYFTNAGFRVQVVLPAQWLQTKSQRRNDDGGGSYHSTDESPALVSEITPQLEVLHGLREQGLLCAAPANDDDDSYAIMLARREDARAARRRGGGQAGQSKPEGGKPNRIVEDGGGFVLSNDQFRDAQSRDRTSSARTGLDEWLEGKKRKGSSRLQDRINTIPGRISYSFGDVGSFDQYGDKELDLIPNPRHPLVEEIEQGNRARELSLA